MILLKIERKQRGHAFCGGFFCEGNMQKPFRGGEENKTLMENHDESWFDDVEENSANTEKETKDWFATQ